MREMCRTKREAKHLFLKNPIDSFLLDNSIDAGDPIWRLFHTSISPTPSFLTIVLLQFLNNVFWPLGLVSHRLQALKYLQMSQSKTKVFICLAPNLADSDKLMALKL